MRERPAERRTAELYSGSSSTASSLQRSGRRSRVRRSRWFCLLSESSLAWTSADHPDNLKILVVFENGSILNRNIVKSIEEIPIPPGRAKSFRSRQKNINLITYDRLRVLTTELRRLVSEGRYIELRLSPGVTLNRQEITKVLRWV